MKSFGRPQCPYCGKKIDYITAWMLRRKGEYLCSRCRGISNVKLDMKVPFLAVAAIITSLILFLILNFLFKVEIIKSLFWTLLPIFIFYIASMFLVRLKKPVMKKVPKKKGKTSAGRERTPNYNTSSVNYKGLSNEWGTQDNFENTKIL